MISGDIHAWESNGQWLVSFEATKRLLSFPTKVDAINWLYLNGHKDAARALHHAY